MELFDIVDENGRPAGERVDRETAHREGLRHRTSHVWIARFRARADNGEQGYGGDAFQADKEEAFLDRVELLLQRRSKDKDSNPGCLDISSAGHIPAGCSYVESALRELSEELGIHAKPEELHFCGKRRKEYRKDFHGYMFHDNQVSNVYLMFRDLDAGQIIYQKSELDGVLWMPFNEVYRMVWRDEKKIAAEGIQAKVTSCIALEEMELLRNYLCDHFDVLCDNPQNRKAEPNEKEQNKRVKLTTLCYIEQEGKYLMLYRNKKENDQSAGKWLGVGGKLEQGESPEDCVKREVYEETGLTLRHCDFRGVVTFVSDIWDNELMFLYTAADFAGELTASCNEGELAWIPKEEVLSLPAWEGDRRFLKPLLNGEKDIHIKLVYEGERLVSAE